MRIVPFALVLTLLCSQACAEQNNKLFGSIGELYPLDFNEVRVRKQQTDLVLDYINEVDRTVEKPCRLVIETAELDIKPNVQIADELFTPSVHLSRVMVAGESFPDIQRGELEFETYEFKGGGRVDGQFFINFVNGRDLYGTFGADVVEVVGE
jgi:hypothetical protein